MVFGGTLSLWIGPRAATFLGCTLATSGVALSYISIKHSFLSFFITYGLLFGFGQGIAYVTAVTTWAPDKVGLISGIVAAGFGVSSSIFVPIQTAIVNPDNLPPTDGYFLQRDLLERVPNLFLTLSCIYAGMQLIGLIVVCDPPEVVCTMLSFIYYICKCCVNTLTLDQCELNSLVHIQIRCSGLGSLSDYVANLRLRNKSNLHRFSSVAYKPLRMQDDAITNSLRFTISSETLPRRRSVSRESRSSSDDSQLLQNEELYDQEYVNKKIITLYSTFAETFIDDDFFLAKAFSIGSIANAFARIGWGYLTDRTSFQVINFNFSFFSIIFKVFVICIHFQTAVSIATCCASALLLTMPLARDVGKIMYLTWVIFWKVHLIIFILKCEFNSIRFQLIGTFICMGATHALFITAAVKCFGSKYKATNYGFLIFSTVSLYFNINIYKRYIYSFSDM
uniref:MFS domain-containing protein n=1 Tax=Heterorhabditis bacteriophora TaxID=37862 RepID=A0A1I7XMG0_HETBA